MPSKKAPKTLTKPKALARVKEYLYDWGNFLGLMSQWEVRLRWVDKPEMREGKVGAAASVHWEPGYKTATIYLLENEFREVDDYTAEAYVLHELLHLVYAPLADTLGHYVGVDTVVSETMAFEEESLVDSLTNHLLRARYGEEYVQSHLDKLRVIQ